MALEFDQLEIFFEDLALTLDSIAESDRELFLCKLCLLLARETGEPEGLKEMIRSAGNHLSRLRKT